jgi:PAS domain S-box-containing protein
MKKGLISMSDLDFYAVFRSAPDLYLLLSPALVILEASDAYIKATMTTREKIVGHDLFEIFLDVIQDEVNPGDKNLRESLDRVFRNKVPDAMAVQRYDIRSGELGGDTFVKRYWSPLNSPVLDDNNEVKYIIHRVEDVTNFVNGERGSLLGKKILSHEKLQFEILKRAPELQAVSENFTKSFEAHDLQNVVELSLVKSRVGEKILAAKKRYRAIMENASCGIVIHNIQGELIEINKQAKALFGDITQPLAEKNITDFVVAADKEYLLLQFKKLIRQKSIGSSHIHIQQANGHVINVECSSVFIEDDNESYVISILNDMTESNRLLSQTLLSDKLATIGTLAAGIIHEINNPMIWILNNLSYLDDKVKGLKANNFEQKSILIKMDETIGESLQGAERIRDIIHDLKGYTRIDENTLTPVDVNVAIKSAINMAYPQFKNRAKLETSFDLSIPILLLNSNKLQQIFLNLIVNASQSLNKSHFDHNIIRITTYMSKNNIGIDIADTGAGIAPEVLPKIFDPFFTTKPVGVGTGLGLSISHEIIHNLGGEITVKSDLNIGTTFSVCLPLQLKVQESNDAVIVPVILQAGRKKLLVIDDEPTLLRVMKQILSTEHDITVSDGRAALSLLAQHGNDFDGLITDVNMPDVNGIDLYRYVLKQYPGLEKRIIFVTGGDYTSSATEFLSTIKNPCLEKPFTPAELYLAVNKIFANP